MGQQSLENTEPQNLEEGSSKSISDNVSKTSKKDETNVLKIVFFVFLFLVFLILAGITVLYFILRPRIILARGITMLAGTDSREMEMHVENFGVNKEAVNLSLTKQMEKTKIDVIVEGNSGPGEVFQTKQLSLIEAGQKQYIKADHSRKNDLLTQFLTLYPELDSLDEFHLIKPIFWGDSWLVRKNDSLELSYDASDFDFLKSFLTTFALEINNFSQKTSVDQEKIFVYDLFFNEPGLEGFFLAAIKDLEEKSDPASHQLRTLLEETEDWEDFNLKLFLNKKDLRIKKLEAWSPPLELPVKEITLEEAARGEITPFGYILQNFVNVSHEDPDSSVTKLLEITFASPEDIEEIQIPTATVGLDSLDEGTQELLLFVVSSFFFDAELEGESLSQSNQFSTKSHETKLFFTQGNYDEMLASSENLKEVASSDEEKAIAHYWTGLSYYKLSNLDNAEFNLIEATKLDSSYAAPYVTLAAISYEKGAFQQGLDYSLKCAELDSDYAWCYNNIGLGYLYKNDYDQGIQYLEKAVELDPLSFVFNDNLKRAREAKAKL